MMRPQRSAKEMIQEGLEEYHYETVVGPLEEIEMMQNYEKRMNQLYKKKEKRIEAFVKNHLEENNYEICGKCYKSCGLLDETFGCGYVGLKVEGNFEGKNLEMKTIPKGSWDEIFVPMSDEFIKKITAIF